MMPAAPGPGVPRNDLPKGAEPPAAPPRPRYRWYHMLGAAALIAVCTAMGLFLLVFPWSTFWEANTYVLEVPAIQDYWSSPYLRLAVSGLGLVNLFFALVDLVRFRRFFEP
ncbi:MAG: hypothetical protein ABSH37_22150 [Bryobacteraceae bacterium]|jgi:hypothetical protein